MKGRACRDAPRPALSRRNPRLSAPLWSVDGGYRRPAASDVSDDTDESPERPLVIDTSSDQTLTPSPTVSSEKFRPGSPAVTVVLSRPGPPPSLSRPDLPDTDSVSAVSTPLGTPCAPSPLAWRSQEPSWPRPSPVPAPDDRSPLHRLASRFLGMVRRRRERALDRLPSDTPPSSQPNASHLLPPPPLEGLMVGDGSEGAALPTPPQMQLPADLLDSSSEDDILLSPELVVAATSLHRWGSATCHCPSARHRHTRTPCPPHSRAQ